MIKNLPDRIFLCGFMGAGKSTLGERLARRLDQNFMDLDSYIEQQADATIPQIFEEYGEEEFRRKERSAILDVIKSRTGVIALGGGTLQNQHLVDHIKLNGLLIFIATPFSIIFERILEEPGRPLLLDENGNRKPKEILREELKALYKQRLPLYRQAVLQIDITRFGSTDDALEELISKIENHVSYH